jgi:hypothetical protein
MHGNLLVCDDRSFYRIKLLKDSTFSECDVNGAACSRGPVGRKCHSGSERLAQRRGYSVSAFF